jgi:Zn-dependent protease with chaperone function
MKRLILILAAALLFAGATLAQQQPTPAESEPATQVQQPPQASPETAAPAAETKKPVTEFTLPPEKYEKAVAFSRAKYQLYFIDFVYGLIVLGALLAWRVAPKFRDWAEHASQRRFVQVLIFAPLMMLTLDVLGLPTSIYRQSLSLKYEQSIQSWGSWFWDWTKGEIIGLILSTFLIWILYGVIRRSPRRWWFYFWLAALPIIVFLIFIGPLVIDPLFFKFTPLESKQPQLVAQIEQVVKRGGLEIPRERMFEMNASSKMKSLNAYVTGFGASKRVVVWDNTIQRMTPGQTLFVFGHEMGHYVLNHIPRTIGFISVVLLVALFLGYHAMHGAQHRWGERWGIRGIDDWASLPVLLLFFSVFSFFVSPVINTYSRAQEHESDVYGIEVIHGIVENPADAGAEAFQALGEINLADPNPHPFIKVWLYSHPPLNERIAFVRSYDPWSRGEPRKFVQ